MFNTIFYVSLKSFYFLVYDKMTLVKCRWLRWCIIRNVFNVLKGEWKLVYVTIHCKRIYKCVVEHSARMYMVNLRSTILEMSQSFLYCAHITHHTNHTSHVIMSSHNLQSMWTKNKNQTWYNYIASCHNLAFSELYYRFQVRTADSSP